MGAHWVGAQLDRPGLVPLRKARFGASTRHRNALAGASYPQGPGRSPWPRCAVAAGAAASLFVPANLVCGRE